MDRSRFDRDRMLLYAVLLSALVSIVLYVIVYLTVVQIGPLNETGMLVSRVALFVSGGALALALVLALTARSASLSGAALSGSGWFLLFGGIALLFPAWGISISNASGMSGVGGFAGAIFLLLAGGLLLQAERTARERQDTRQSR